MPIFLHFLNREVYRAANVPFSGAAVYDAVRVLTIGQAAPLYTNYSNILEGGFLDAGAPSPLIRLLVIKGHLLIAGERPSLHEFIDSRSEMYFFDRDRYPMYFRPQTFDFDAPPSYVRQSSVTDFLQGEIEQLSRGLKGPRELGVAPRDVKVIADSADALGRIVLARGSNAITRTLFQERLKAQGQIEATARLISGLYISRYLTDLRAVLVTGFPGLAVFDHLNQSFTAFLDVPIVRAILRRVGFTDILLTSTAQKDELIAALRGSDLQVACADSIRTICDAFDVMFGNQAGVERRASVAGVLARSEFVDASSNNKDLYAAARATLTRLLVRLRHIDVGFANAFEVVMAKRNSVRVVLIMTATKVETQALTEALKQTGASEPAYISKVAYTARDFGVINNLRMIHVQSEPGSVGASSSQAVAADAIRDFSPAAVISVGIAFGMKPDKQKVSDVLVSRMVTQYEKVKLKEGHVYQRGERAEASPKLLSLFRAAEAEGFEVAIHFGIIVSGEKLVDDKAFVEELREQEPEAVGGEMEAAGIMSAANRAKANWIMVKSIVDWAHNKEAHNSESHQLEVARVAVRFVMRALIKMGI
jgi:nucleoside phosphorylase